MSRVVASESAPHERVPVDVMQGVGRGLASQVMDGQHAGVAAAHHGELAGVLVAAAAQHGGRVPDMHLGTLPPQSGVVTAELW